MIDTFSFKINNRLTFSQDLLKFSNLLKKIHPNLPAALSDYLNNLTDFNQEINNILEELKKKSTSGIISPFEFKERKDNADIAKKEITSCCSSELFMKHIQNISDISKKNIL